MKNILYLFAVAVIAASCAHQEEPTNIEYSIKDWSKSDTTYTTHLDGGRDMTHEDSIKMGIYD